MQYRVQILNGGTYLLCLTAERCRFLGMAREVCYAVTFDGALISTSPPNAAHSREDGMHGELVIVSLLLSRGVYHSDLGMQRWFWFFNMLHDPAIQFNIPNPCRGAK